MYDEPVTVDRWVVRLQASVHASPGGMSAHGTAGHGAVDTSAATLLF